MLASPGTAHERPRAGASEEGLRLVSLADERGLRARLLGGVAFELLLPGWTDTGRSDAAPGRDIDLATRRSDARELAQLLAEAGYEPDAHHNALYGYKQLYFVDPVHRRPLDVLVGALEMCHRLEFDGRMELEHPTLPLADLLLSKLQVVRLNRKDAADVLGLLSHYPLADDDRRAINVGRIVSITAGDWGWWRTTVGSLETLRRVLVEDGELAERARAGPLHAAAQIETLDEALRSSPKSRRWRARALIGARVRWYQEPEEVAH